MTIHATALDAAIRAIRGESNISAMTSVFDHRGLAQVVALAQDAHPIIRAVAALRCELFDLLDTRIIADPALHDAIVRMIGTDAGRRILASWTMVAPADWGLVHAATLMDAVQRNECSPWVAAALIGPCNRSAELLHGETDAAFAIQCWGKAFPDEPTAWMYAISAEHRDRLINTVQRHPYLIARCIPWLPQDMAKQAPLTIALDMALNAFAEASPTARSRHGALLQYLVAQARPTHLEALIRLIDATQTGAYWERVQTLVRTSPDDARRVVIAAPWNVLSHCVRDAILEYADQSDICAAIAAARGEKIVNRITRESAAAFFATLDSRMWDALEDDVQRRWLHALWKEHAHLAVRSLGLRPEVMAKADVSDRLVHAARRHAHDAAMLKNALLPIALRDLPPDASYALIVALPQPHDPGAFFVIASNHSDPSVTAAARVALHAHDVLACAIVLQRSADHDESVRNRCKALHDALRDKTQDDLAPILPLLSTSARTMCMPKPAAIVRRLAHPDRHAALRRALDHLTSLPPKIAIPTQVALRMINETRRSDDAATVIAIALRMHGDLFLSIVDALANDPRAALLPLPKNDNLARALRALAHDDPSTAQRLARALRAGHGRAAHALLTAPSRHADAIWCALSEEERHAIRMEIPSLPPIDSETTPIDLIETPARKAGITALESHAATIRTIENQLPHAIR